MASRSTVKVTEGVLLLHARVHQVPTLSDGEVCGRNMLHSLKAAAYNQLHCDWGGGKYHTSICECIFTLTI